MQSVLAYVREGQDPQLTHEAGFVSEVNGETRWYHVPWMAYDPTAGREFIHGTTNERTAHLSDFIGDGRDFGVHSLPELSAECMAQYPHGFETWAVGMYNPWGGWSVGQVCGDTGAQHIGEYMGRAMAAGGLSGSIPKFWASFCAASKLLKPNSLATRSITSPVAPQPKQ